MCIAIIYVVLHNRTAYDMIRSHLNDDAVSPRDNSAIVTIDGVDESPCLLYTYL